MYSEESMRLGVIYSEESYPASVEFSIYIIGVLYCERDLVVQRILGLIFNLRCWAEQREPQPLRADRHTEVCMERFVPSCHIRDGMCARQRMLCAYSVLFSVYRYEACVSVGGSSLPRRS